MPKTTNLDSVEQVAEDFIARLREGKRPSIREYAQRFPQFAEEIEATFEALAMMENLAPGSDDSFGVDSQPPSLVGVHVDQLGDYRIIREIGRGGMGIVYEAEQVSLGRHVALKVLPKELLATTKHRHRFEREAKAAAKLHHTNIVPVFGVGQENDMGYYVMQFIQGLALDEVLEELKRMSVPPGSAGGVQTGQLRASRRDALAADVAQSLMTGTFQQPVSGEGGDTGEQDDDDETLIQPAQIATRPPTSSSSSTTAGRLSDSFSVSDSSVALPGAASSRSEKTAKKRTYWDSVAQIGVQVAGALQYAHAQGVLHRDIKPSNLLLDMQGTVWVTDFGLAKLDDDRGLTETGDVLGTLRYMAPEAFKGQADARSEVYSLGLTLYELLAFRPAFDRTQRKPLIDQVLNADIEPLAKLNPAIPRDLETIVHKAIERDPQHRYQTAQELDADLQRFIDDDPIKARRISLVERFRRWSRQNKGLAAALSFAASLLLLLALGSTIAAGFLKKSASLARLNEQRAEDNEQNAKETAAKAEAERDVAQRLSYAATIQLAEAMLSGGDASRFRVADLLWSTQTDLRGWEWGHLMARCPLEQWSMQTHGSGLASLTTSPDGRYMATAGGDGAVVLWDVSRRSELWHHQSTRPGRLQIDPGNRFVAFHSEEHGQQNLTILDLATGREVHREHQVKYPSIVFSPDGKAMFVATGKEAAGRVWLWRFDTESWQHRAVPVPAIRRMGHSGVFVDSSGAYVGHFLRFNGNPQEYQPKFAIFDAQSLELVPDFDSLIEPCVNAHSGGIPTLDATRGTVIFSDVVDVVRRSLDGKRTILTSLPSPVQHLNVHAESGNIVAASRDGFVRIIHANGQRRELLHGAPINGLAVLPDGRLITGGADGLVKCWNPSGPLNLSHCRTPADIPTASGVFAGISGDNRKLVFMNHGRTEHYIVDMWSLGVRAQANPNHSRSRVMPWFRPGTNQFLLTDPTGFSWRQLAGNDPNRSPKRIEVAEPHHFAFDGLGRVLVVASGAEKTYAFDITTGRPFPSPQVSGIGHSAVGPTAKRAATLTLDDLQIWEIASGRVLNHWKVPHLIASVKGQRRALDYHPTEELVALIADRYVNESSRPTNSIVRLWDAERGEMLSELEVKAGTIPRMCRFSSDGTRLFVGNYYGSVHIWDWRVGKFLLALPASRGRANSIAQSPDGLTLAYTGYEPSLQICKALPWILPRDAEFYWAVDELRAFTKRTIIGAAPQQVRADGPILGHP